MSKLLLAELVSKVFLPQKSASITKGGNPKTARAWLDLLAWSYQWIDLPAYSGNAIKKLSARLKGHFADTWLAGYLNVIPTPESLLNSPLFGHLFEPWGVGWIARQT